MKNSDTYNPEDQARRQAKREAALLSRKALVRFVPEEGEELLPTRNASDLFERYLGLNELGDL